MNSTHFQFTIVLLLISSLLCGQENTAPLILNEITFLGLTKTKVTYLKELIFSKEKQPTTLSAIEKDLQILKNTPGLKNVEFKLDTTDREIGLNFLLEERITALPSVNLGGIKDNFWFSLGYVENNFQGIGDFLLAYYQNNDGRHSGQLYYRKNRIGNSQYGMSFSLNKWASIEPLFFREGTFDYLYDFTSFTVTGIRNINQRGNVEIGLNYFVEKYSLIVDDISEFIPSPTKLTQPKLLNSVKLTWNRLDYDLFYLKGHQSTLNFQSVFTFEDKSLFTSFAFEDKLFFLLNNKLNLATRFRFAIATNNESPFAPFVVDSHINIRGVGNRIDRGTAQIILNLELRYTTFQKKNWGSQLIVFTDSGTWRNPGGALSDLFDTSEFRQFVGGGVRLIYQKVFGAVIRLDYGIDAYNPKQRGVVLGLGQYF